MGKPFKLFASIAVAAVFLSANPAAAGGRVPAYNTLYYSDASLQNQVGGNFWSGCQSQYPGDDQVIYTFVGTYTQYYTQELAGYCWDGEMVDP